MAAITMWIASQVVAITLLILLFQPGNFGQYLLMVTFVLVLSTALNRVSFNGVRQLADELNKSQFSSLSN